MPLRVFTPETSRALRESFHVRPWLSRASAAPELPTPSEILPEAMRLARTDRVAFRASHPHDAWLRREVSVRPYAPLPPDDVLATIAAKTAVQFNGLEHLAEAPGASVSSFAKRLAATLDWLGPIGIAVTISPPGAIFETHLDPAGAIFVQMKGEKRYWFSEAPILKAPRAKGFLFSDGKIEYGDDLDALPDAEPWEEVTWSGTMREEILRPGDLLYVPAGTLHRTEAITASEAYFFMFMERPFASLVDETLAREHASRVAWRQTPPGPPEAWLLARIDETIDALTKWKSDLAPLRLTTEAAIARASKAHHARSDESDGDVSVRADDRLARSDDPAIRWVTREQTLHVLVGDEDLELESPWAEWIAGASEPFVAGSLVARFSDGSSEDWQSVRDTLEALLSRGVIVRRDR